MVLVQLLNSLIVCLLTVRFFASLKDDKAKGFFVKFLRNFLCDIKSFLHDLFVLREAFVVFFFNMAALAVLCKEKPIQHEGV